MKIKVVANQTLRDVAIKYYGNIEAMAEIIDNNPQLRNNMLNDTFSLDGVIMEGLELEIDKTSFLERQNITRELKNYEINTFDNGEEN